MAVELKVALENWLLTFYVFTILRSNILII